MKRLLLASLALGALAGSAMAADLARPVYRRAAVVAAPIYTWTGFYVGGNVGYGWGNARTDIAGGATTIALPDFLGGVPGNNVAFADSSTARLNRVIGGGQIGYNYQFNPRWVLGFEADIQDSGKRESHAFADPFSTSVCTLEVVVFPDTLICRRTSTLIGTAATVYDAKIAWFGTLRGRLGFLITDQFLLYGTGGLAYGGVELSGATNAAGSLNRDLGFIEVIPLAPGASAFSESRTEVGYVVGGGVEGKFSYWAGWTWKLEYLFVDLGSLDTVAPFPGGSALVPEVPTERFTSPFTGIIATHTHFTDNIVRVGLNYKFGNYYAPVVTK